MEMKIEQLRKMRKIDTHSHIGVDARNPVPSALSQYCEYAGKKNIQEALLIGVPNPCYETRDGIYTPINWEVEGNNLNVYSELVKSDGSHVRGRVEANPFSEANKRLESEVEGASSSKLKLHYIPLVHPILDSQSQLEKTLEKKPLAIKVKGSAWGVDPRDIPETFFKTAKKYDVPVLVHTDYNASGSTRPDHVMNGAQDPLIWLDLFEKYGNRASLAHGLRLCKESWERVSKTGNQFLVGFGPRLTTRGFRVKKRHGDYVTDLMDMADPSKLAFDLDYSWNKDDNGEGEWDLDEELIGKLSPELFQDFYTGNAERFYKINKGGID